MHLDYCLGANGRSKHKYKGKVFYFSETDSGIHIILFPHLIEHGILEGIDRVTGRKARILQTEEIGCKCLLKFCVAMTTPGST